MKYNISAFTGTNLQIAQEPEIGVEAVVKVAYSPFGTVALVEQDAADSGATASVSNAYSIPVAGVDLAIMCDNAMLSDVALVITLNVVDEDDAATTAVATFTRPTWS